VSRGQCVREITELECVVCMRQRLTSTPAGRRSGSRQRAGRRAATSTAAKAEAPLQAGRKDNRHAVEQSQPNGDNRTLRTKAIAHTQQQSAVKAIRRRGGDAPREATSRRFQRRALVLSARPSHARVRLKVLRDRRYGKRALTTKTAAASAGEEPATSNSAALNQPRQ